ncbi:endonuclease/exonuclease/phosphatase family protein [Gilvimarinus sp. F26214L]|uniref:endonuclease/exonuclease/phosphatase family protein n=1 Tax=Gilvimarinus sp. DZF01 TaxID=3461371 RepID=UPI004046529B
MSLRIVSYNIHSGVGVDGRHCYERIGRFLMERKVDLALLQEMDTRPHGRDAKEYIAALCGSHFRELIPSPAVYEGHGWYGNAVLTRFPVMFSQTIDVSHFGRQPRNIQEVILQTGRGLLHVLNTHKGLKRIERREQFGKLGAHLQQPSAIPTVVGGDFNEWQLFSARLRKLDQLLEPQSMGATFPTRWPVFRLDRFWTRPAGMVKSARVLKTPETRIYSDHYPIEMTLELPQSTEVAG